MERSGLLQEGFDQAHLGAGHELVDVDQDQHAVLHCADGQQVVAVDLYRAMAHAVRVWAKAHPGRYETTVRAPEPGDSAGLEASARAVQVMFDALAGYGLTGDDAIDATRNFRASIHGFVALEAAGGFGLPRDVDRSFDRVVAGLRLSLGQWADIAA